MLRKDHIYYIPYTIYDQRTIYYYYIVVVVVIIIIILATAVGTPISAGGLTRFSCVAPYR